MKVGMCVYMVNTHSLIYGLHMGNCLIISLGWTLEMGIIRSINDDELFNNLEVIEVNL